MGIAAAPTYGNTEGQAIGIIGAMESEIATIKNAMEDVRVTTISGVEFAEGTICSNNVVVQCGVGKVNAAICAQVLIQSFGVACVINTGVAGSLTDKLSINDFVVSTDAVQHDVDATVFGFKRGEVPYSGVDSFPADEQLRAKAVCAVKRAAPTSTVLEGRVCSGDQFIHTAEQRNSIASNFGGLCCEMEGGAIAQICYLNQVPFVIIRAISDGSDAMDYELFQVEAARECAEAILAMCARE